MKHKAVIFDLFETLITEWGHKKYTKNEMCADLGIERKIFDIYWEEKEQERYIGKMTFEDSILYACKNCGKHVDNLLLSDIVDKRMTTKSKCFEYVIPDVFQLLRLCDQILMPCAEDVYAMAKIAQYQHMLKVLRYQELESRTMYINMGKNMRQTVKETVELLKESTEKRFFYAEGRTTS